MNTRPEQKISDQKYKKDDEYHRSSKIFTLSLIPKSRNMSVLDVGCGTGVNSEYIRQQGHKVTGIDISRVAIKKYRARGLNGIACDINNGFPFSDESFDMLFASEIIEHIHDSSFFFAEANRLLRPGGVLLLSTPNSAFILYRLLGIFGRTVTDLQHPGHIRFFSKRSLSLFCQTNGFVSVKLSGRHMYMMLGEKIGHRLGPLLSFLGFQKEYRFRNNTYFWHLSRHSGKASALWADTLILEATKSLKNQ
jgi:2-polyprenyl-3-methyl-5-hydroxy-6-metoxy-1,4-benzoquinol methylase